jgi:hypothetical protein
MDFIDWYIELFESGKGVKLNQQEIAEEAWDYRKDEIDQLKKQVAQLEALLYGEEK